MSHPLRFGEESDSLWEVKTKKRVETAYLFPLGTLSGAEEYLTR